jgi:hypothetical protein
MTDLNEIIREEIKKIIKDEIGVLIAAEIKSYLKTNDEFMREELKGAIEDYAKNSSVVNLLFNRVLQKQAGDFLKDKLTITIK